MAEILLRVLARAGQTLQNPFAMGGQYVRPHQGEAARDFEKVTRDMRTVGADLRKATKRELQRHGK